MLGVPYRRSSKIALLVSILLIHWVHCQNNTQPATDHLDKLFTRVTSTGQINETQLEKFLSDLKLLPDDHHHDEHNHTDHLQCYSAHQFLENSGPDSHMSVNEFRDILPTIVYEIISDACHHEEEHEGTRILDWKVITAATAAVLIISASGSVVVALLPLMPPNFYNVVTQFLIALSVGSLIGDAFLHLIPHALSGDHAHEHDDASYKQEHLRMISMSVVAVLGVYVFFLTERLTILYQNKSSKSRKVRREPVFIKDETALGKEGGDAMANNLPNGRLNGTPPRDSPERTRSPRLAHANWSSDYQKVSTSPVTQWSSPLDGPPVSEFASPCDENPLCNRPPLRPLDNAHCEDHLRGYLDIQPDRSTPKRNDLIEGAQPLYTPHPDSCKDPQIEHKNSIDSRAQGVSALSHSPQVNLDAVSTRRHSTNALDDDEDEEQPAHLHKDRPHGHHHGHSHDLTSLRAIAYTVIAGDGLHNFCDGIAIGAAFANSLQGGLSTSIAVLCHELPHEVGDFAVLLNAGISVRSAMLCNLLSSLLCACGTVIGLSVGRLNSVDAWLFMLTAGMFVYIALVDMMPELATSRLKGHRYCHRPSLLFMWQNFGILFGCAVMLLIALFEAKVI